MAVTDVVLFDLIFINLLVIDFMFYGSTFESSNKK